MKYILFSLLLLGSAVTIFANAESVGVELPIKRQPNGIQCSASTGFQRLVSGGYCYSREVMVGIHQLSPSLIIRCAEVQVQCNQIPSETGNE